MKQDPGRLLRAVFILGLAFQPGQQGSAQAPTSENGRNEPSPVLVRAKYEEGPIIAVTFSPDGGRVLTAHADQNHAFRSPPAEGHYGVRVWDAASGRTLVEFFEKAPVYAVDFAPDGSRFATGGAERSIVQGIRPLRAGERGGEFERRTVDIEGGVVKIWNTESGRSLQILTGNLDSVRAVRFGKDETLFSLDGYALRMWNLRTGREMLVLDGHKLKAAGLAGVSMGTHQVHAVGLTPQGFSNVLLEELKHQRISLHEYRRKYGPILRWDLRKNRFWGSGGEPGAYLCIALSPDESRFATVTSSNLVGIWDFERCQRLLQFPIQAEKRVDFLEYSPDGSRLVTGHDDGSVRLWDAATGQLIRTAQGPEGPIRAVLFLPGRLKVGTGGEGEFRAPEPGKGPSAEGALKLWEMKLPR